jgi:hypothetical protein
MFTTHSKGDVMKLNALMVINALVTAVFGVAFLLVPYELMSLYGVRADALLAYVGQLFGAALVVLAIVTWLARNVTDPQATRAITFGLFIGDAVGFLVALRGQLSHVVNTLGWSTVALYLLLAVGFGYFAFRRPATTS